MIKCFNSFFRFLNFILRKVNLFSKPHFDSKGLLSSTGIELKFSGNYTCYYYSFFLSSSAVIYICIFITVHASNLC